MTKELLVIFLQRFELIVDEKKNIIIVDESFRYIDLSAIQGACCRAYKQIKDRERVFISPHRIICQEAQCVKELDSHCQKIDLATAEVPIYPATQDELDDTAHPYVEPDTVGCTPCRLKLSKPTHENHKGVDKISMGTGLHTFVKICGATLFAGALGYGFYRVLERSQVSVLRPEI